MVLRARNRHQAGWIDRFHFVPKHARLAMGDWAVGMIVLVVQIEERVAEFPQRNRDRANGVHARRLGREQPEGLSGKLTRPQQYELEDHPARLEPLRQLEKARPPHIAQRTVRSVDRLVPMRPDAHQVDAPRLQGIQIVIAHAGRPKRVEQADTHDELRASIQLKSLASNYNGRTRRWRDEGDQRERADRDGDAYSETMRPGTR